LEKTLQKALKKQIDLKLYRLQHWCKPNTMWTY